MAALWPRRRRDQGRILCYHAVGTREWGFNDISPGRFRRHLELALSWGYRFVDAAAIARTGGAPNELAITFDDAVTSVATNAIPILNELGVPATVFVVSGRADGNGDFPTGTNLDWNGVASLAAQGLTIGSHSVSHRDFGKLSLDEARGELLESRRAIEARIGIRATAFAIPFGQSANWRTALNRLAHDAGYEIIYAQSEELRTPGTIPRTVITRYDDDQIFRAALAGVFDRWEVWI